MVELLQLLVLTCIRKLTVELSVLNFLTSYTLLENSCKLSFNSFISHLTEQPSLVLIGSCWLCWDLVAILAFISNVWHCWADVRLLYRRAISHNSPVWLLLPILCSLKSSLELGTDTLLDYLILGSDCPFIVSGFLPNCYFVSVSWALCILCSNDLYYSSLTFLLQFD